MEIYRFIKKLIDQELEVIQNNQLAVNKANKDFFTAFLVTGLVVVFGLFLFTFVEPSYQYQRTEYAILAFLISLTIVLQHTADAWTKTWMYYLIYGIFAIYATYSSAFVSPASNNLFMMLYLLELPIIFLDNSPRIIFFEITTMAFYIFAIMPYKLPSILVSEIVNTIVVGSIAIVTGIYFRRARLQNIELNRHLNLESNIDALTRLPNRRLLFEDFAQIARGSNPCMPVAIAMLDIDDFKKYNDTYGHQAGDICLTKVAQCMAQFGQKHAMTFYRYGGEEFLALVYNDQVQDIVELFTNLNLAISNLRIPHKNSKWNIITTSIGVVQLQPEEHNLLDTKMKEADKALYLAKSQGKNITIDYQTLNTDRENNI